MFNIAFCDDDEKEIDHFENICKEYIEQRDFDVNVECTQSGNKLIDVIANGKRYDVIFLDIIMAEINGVDVAQEIRKYDTKCKIIFLTISEDFAYRSYSVKAYNYIIKPLDLATLSSQLDEIYKEKIRRINNTIFVKSKKSQLIEINIDDIEFMNTSDHYLTYYLIDGSEVTTRESIAEATEKLLLFKNFIRPHRSYIINMNNIGKLETSHFLSLSGKKIPISRNNSKEVTNCYLEYKLHNLKGE